MQAVILAGGQGTRLRPLTLTRPKPLVPIVNVPMIRHIVDRLPPEVDRVILAVNYKLDLLREYFEKNDCGKEVVLVEETEPLGTGGAVKNVERHVDDTFFVFNGDILDSLSLTAFRRFHDRTGGLGSIALWKVSDPRHYGIVEMRGSRITRFVEKPATKDEAPSNLANAGTYLLEPEVFDTMAPGKVTSIEREVFPALIEKGGGLFGYPFEGFWVDVGRPETYLKAHELMLKTRSAARVLGDGVKDHGAGFEGWNVVGDACDLGQGSELSHSVLFDRVRLGHKAVAKHSILGEGVTLEDDAAVVDSVLGDGVTVRKGVFLKGVKIDPNEIIGDSNG
ncbi:MAG TPA: NDP-sugar synthase [Candidatus Thermoplasmatota archaeon]|nr:NDP-sugar synthase [Candidatus Thermoplasmatota archaeon]